MSRHSFKVGGGLTDEHAVVYINRESDRLVADLLRSNDYVLIIEPRQQGKTSLVNAIMRDARFIKSAFVYIDITTLDRSNEYSWYQSLCKRVLRQLRSITANHPPTIPQNSAQFRDFLSELMILAENLGKSVVISLDEIGAVSFSWTTEFFSVFRDAFSSRQIEPEWKLLSCMLVGAFHPRELIADDSISPFNIAHRVRLPDLTLEQVQTLVRLGMGQFDRTDALGERIFYWTSGQPYLTQLIGSHLEPNSSPKDVDDCITRVRRDDENHLPPLIHRLEKDPKLLEYLQKIQQGERIHFYPQENKRQESLELLGLIKADPDGFCAIRNRIYELVINSYREKVSFEERLRLPSIQAGRVKELEEELAQRNRNLQLLRKKKATFAAGEEPLHLQNQIDAEQREISRLTEELAAIQGQKSSDFP